MAKSNDTVFYRDKSGNLRVFNTNKYMNDFIRNKGKVQVVKDLQSNVDKDYKGHLEIQKQKEWDYKKHEYKEKHDTYYQLDNGEKVEFLDKKEYKKMIDDFYDSLTQEEKEAIEIWVDDPWILSGNSPWKLKKDYNKIFNNVIKNKAVELPRDTLLFRRADTDYLDLLSGVNTDYNFSTSAYDTLPKTMPSGISFGEKEIYIIAPKGTKVLPIEKVAVNHPSNDEGEKKVYARQHEIILSKGTSYEMLEDRSTYYYRSPKSNEIGYHPITEQQYVVKLTDKKYNKIKYDRPEYRFQWDKDGYQTYIYKHKGKKIEIEEKNISRWWDNDDRNKKSRKDVVKYRVSSLENKGKPEYYDTYDEAVKAIKEYM